MNISENIINLLFIRSMKKANEISKPGKKRELSGTTSIRVPDEFELLGRTIKVVWDPDLVREQQAKGEAIFNKDLIKLHAELSGRDAENTFFHELVHFCLYMMGKRELTHNEEFVVLLSGLLHQALVTATYNQPRRNNPKPAARRFFRKKRRAGTS